MDAITGPAYCVETKRLVIRCWNPGDALLLKAAVDESLDHLRPWMDWASKEPTGLQEKIGYWVHQDYINQGLATETAAALTRVAFEVDRVERVEIHCAAENARSAAVPRKLGYTLEATLRQRSHLGGGQVADSQVWTLLAGEYPGSLSAQAELLAFDAAGRRII